MAAASLSLSFYVVSLSPSVAKIVRRDICDLWARETDIPGVATSAFSAPVGTSPPPRSRPEWAHYLSLEHRMETLFLILEDWFASSAITIAAKRGKKTETFRRPECPYKRIKHSSAAKESDEVLALC